MIICLIIQAGKADTKCHKLRVHTQMEQLQVYHHDRVVAQLCHANAALRMIIMNRNGKKIMKPAYTRQMQHLTSSRGAFSLWAVSLISI